MYFYELAYKLGISRMHRYLTGFGFGEPTGVDLPREATGLVPSREWKLAALGRPWTAGETIISGIGQGYMLSTPLQIATATATIAGRGVRLRPRAAIRVERGEAAEELPVEHLTPVTANAETHWERIINGMEGVVHGRSGTARGIGKGLAYRIAGKTGTAQVVRQATRTAPDDLESIPWERRDHALFAAFAPIDDPRIAVAVVVEHGGSGSRAAAPIARVIIDHHIHGAPPRTDVAHCGPREVSGWSFAGFVPASRASTCRSSAPSCCSPGSACSERTRRAGSRCSIASSCAFSSAAG